MQEEPRRPRQELQIAIVGPIISLGLAVLFGILAVLAGTGGEPTTLRLVVLERQRPVELITANGIMHLTQVRSALGG